LLQLVAPDTLNLPAEHMAAAGVDDVDAAGHAYPALQLLQLMSPDRANLPAGHMPVAGVDEFDPAGHA
jgi:hypothetical protein